MRNAERYMELLALAPGWLDLDSGAVVEQQVAIQVNPGLTELGSKPRHLLAPSNPISGAEETAG